jgi:hypothetical protein
MYLIDGSITNYRSFGSVPWLFPIGRDYHFNVREKDSKDYKPRSVKHLMSEAGAESSWKIFEEYYLSNPLYLKPEKQVSTENEEDYYCNLPRALRPPPLKRMVCINGKFLQFAYFRC